MIQNVTKKTLTYVCDAQGCGVENTVKLEGLVPDANNSVHLPACRACGSIRIVCIDPAGNRNGKPHPGLDSLGNHTPAALEAIHGEALGAALASSDPKKVYKSYLPKL